MSGWGCPHDINGVCTRINDLPCDPGMKGCVLYGRYRFANDEKNERWLKKQAPIMKSSEELAAIAEADHKSGKKSGSL